MWQNVSIYQAILLDLQRFSGRLWSPCRKGVAETQPWDYIRLIWSDSVWRRNLQDLVMLVRGEKKVNWLSRAQRIFALSHLEITRSCFGEWSPGLLVLLELSDELMIEWSPVRYCTCICLRLVAKLMYIIMDGVIQSYSMSALLVKRSSNAVTPVIHHVKNCKTIQTNMTSW